MNPSPAFSCHKEYVYGILCVHLLWNENHLPRHSEKGKKTGQIEEEVGRQHQGMDRPGVRQVPEGNGEQRRMEETDCEIICGAQRPSQLRD